MIVFALAALALVAFVASRTNARRVGGITFIKSGNMNFSYSRSRRPRARPVSVIDDERRGYSARAYTSR